MMDMKSQAIEKLMGVLDELLGGDAKERMKAALDKSEEGPEIEVELPEGEEVASGGSGVLALPELEDEGEPMSEEEEGSKPKGVGLSVKETQVAAMPKPSMMKKMRGKV